MTGDSRIHKEVLISIVAADDMGTLLLAWISNYTHYNVWDEITYPFLNFNGCTVEV